MKITLDCHQTNKDTVWFKVFIDDLGAGGLSMKKNKAQELQWALASISPVHRVIFKNWPEDAQEKAK